MQEKLFDIFLVCVSIEESFQNDQIITFAKS